MPIVLEVNHEEGYYLAKWSQVVTDAEVVSSYRAFFESERWVPGYDSLVDLSELDAADLTANGVNSLARLVQSTFERHKIHPKIAVYAPEDVPYGLARMYSVKVESFESHEVFRNRQDALDWLRGR